MKSYLSQIRILVPAAAGFFAGCTGIQQIASNLPPAGSPALASLTVNGQALPPDANLTYPDLAPTATDSNGEPNQPSAAVTFTVPTQTAYGIYVDGVAVPTVTQLTNLPAQAATDYQTMTLYRETGSVGGTRLDQHTVVITMPDRYQENQITIGITDKSLNGTYSGAQKESAPMKIVLKRAPSGSVYTGTTGSTSTSGSTGTTGSTTSTRTPGAFAAVSTGPTGTQTSPDGKVRATIYQGSSTPGNSYPVDASIPASFTYAAKFTQSQGGTPISGVMPVDFNQGPSFASQCGPGFTANSAYAVILGGTRTGTNQTNTFTVVPLAGSSHAQINFPVATTMNVAGQSSNVVEPEYLASPDGTLAAIVSAPTTTGEPVQVAVFDLTKNGTVVAGSTVDCDGASTLSLDVKADGKTVEIHCQQMGRAKTLTATVQ